MEHDDGLVFAYCLDGKGGGKRLGWDDLADPDAVHGPLWVHLDRAGDRTEPWLLEQAQLPELACEALLADETRPRRSDFDPGLLIILRGVNLNPGADPEDMIALRIWIVRDRIITVRRRILRSVQDVREQLDRRKGGLDVEDIFLALVDKLTERISEYVESLTDRVDTLDAELVEKAEPRLHARLSALRREAIAVRRYLAPQRDLMVRMITERTLELDEQQRLRVREFADSSVRCIEDMDAARDRAMIMQEELAHLASERMNRTMYALSVVASVFLPLGLITGLFGINVGGMPGIEHPAAFAVVCIGLVAIAAGQMWLLRRMGIL